MLADVASGQDISPDYLTADVSAVSPFGNFGPSGSLTLTRSGQLSWGKGVDIGNAGIGASLRSGNYLKDLDGQGMNEAALGKDVSVSASVGVYRGLGPEVSLTRSIGDDPVYAIEGGITWGWSPFPSKTGPVDISGGVSESFPLWRCGKSCAPLPEGQR